MSRRVVVIGAGIVGAAMAAQLSAKGCAVTVVDQSPPGRPRGSTGHAPGFVGMLGDTTVLTALACESVRVYSELSWHGLAGFDTVGGLEIALSPAGVKTLGERAKAAKDVGLPANLLDAEEAAALAPRLVDPAKVQAALHFPQDGTARADVLTAALCDRATAARFIRGSKVTAIEVRGDRVVSVRAGDEMVPADDVVIACGIWGPEVAALAGADLPLTPVAHPYVHSGPRAAAGASSPFVRWPERHVYARDHGDRDGIGTYDHEPIAVPVSELGDRAELAWPGTAFDEAITAALDLLPALHRWRPADRLNGVFSMTADNLPLLGAHAGVDGLWLAEAIWITHAAGAASALTAAMFGERTAAPMAALDPGRFAGRDPGELRRRALALYRDIYATT